MLVWEKIADHTHVNSKEHIADWLDKYNIKSCDLENFIGYTGNEVKCNGECRKCLSNYLDIELNQKEFIEVANEFGEIQLGFGEKFYKKGD